MNNKSTGFITYDILTKNEKSLKAISVELSEISKSLKNVRDMQEPNYKILVNLGSQVPSAEFLKEQERELVEYKRRVKELEAELNRILNIRTDALLNAKDAFSNGYFAGSKKQNFEARWIAYLRSCVKR